MCTQTYFQSITPSGSASVAVPRVLKTNPSLLTYFNSRKDINPHVADTLSSGVSSSSTATTATTATSSESKKNEEESEIDDDFQDDDDDTDNELETSSQQQPQASITTPTATAAAENASKTSSRTNEYVPATRGERIANAVDSHTVTKSPRAPRAPPILSVIDKLTSTLVSLAPTPQPSSNSSNNIDPELKELANLFTEHLDKHPDIAASGLLMLTSKEVCVLKHVYNASVRTCTPDELWQRLELIVKKHNMK